MYGSKLYYKHTHPCNSEREDGGGGGGGVLAVWTNFEVNTKVVTSFQMAQKLGSGWHATLKKEVLELSKLRKKLLHMLKLYLYTF